MAWHLEAVGSGGVRGTGDKKTMELAAYLYKKVVDNFNAGGVRQVRVPAHREGRLAEHLQDQVRDGGLALLPEGLGEVRSGVRLRRRRGPERRPRPPRPRTPRCSATRTSTTRCTRATRIARARATLARRAPTRRTRSQEGASGRSSSQGLHRQQKGMVTAFNRYVCYIKPPQGRQGGRGAVRRGEVRPRAHLLRVAALGGGGARRSATSRSTTPTRTSASTRRSSTSSRVNVLGAALRAAAPACFDDMAQDVPKFLELYCAGRQGREERRAVRTLNEIQGDILRLKAQKLVERGRQGRRHGGARALREGRHGVPRDVAEVLRGARQRTARQPAGREVRRDRVQRGAGLPGRAPPREGDRGPSIAPRVRRQDEAATRRSRRRRSTRSAATTRPSPSTTRRPSGTSVTRSDDPKARDADQALSDAVVLRLGLGQEDQAIKDAQTLQQELRRQEAGADRADRLRDRRALRREGGLGQRREARSPARWSVIDKAAPDVAGPGARDCSAASTSRANKGAAASQAEYAKVRALWEDPGGGRRKHRAAYPDEDDGAKERRLAQGAQRRRRGATSSPPRRSEGRGREDQVPRVQGPGRQGRRPQAHPDQGRRTGSRRSAPRSTKARARVRQDRRPAAGAAAEVGHRRRLARRSDVGRLRRRVPRRADPGRRGRRTTELRGAYYDALDEASEPLKSATRSRRSRSASIYSVKYQYFDEFCRTCEVWLAKNYKAEYHVVDELRGAPTLVEQRSRREGAAGPHRRHVLAPAAQPRRRRPRSTTEDGDGAERQAGERQAGVPSRSASRRRSARSQAARRSEEQRR